MKNKLSLRQYSSIGSMLFGLFFGAGNLIFPVHLGQEAGKNVFWAISGFLITGVGLPFLGVIAIGLSKSNGVFDLAKRINKHYAIFFTVLLYLTIGPFFALPRLATTSYEISVAPFVNENHHAFFLVLFSVIFFTLSWLFAKRPSKLLEYIGKFLNPIFLLLLAILFLFVFINPMGTISSAQVSESYQQKPFLSGFTEGYNTLDALASLSFGILVISTIREIGITEPQTIAKDTIKSGAISIVLMGIIYTLLAYMGTLSLGTISLSDNGGIALTQISDHYLGNSGLILLAIIVLLACLKTAIGLLAACAKMFHELFPKFSYQTFLCMFSLLPCLFANIGLTNIIQYSIPVLMFIYPLAITLMILVILSPIFNDRKEVYYITTYVTLFVAILDALNHSPLFIKDTPSIIFILNIASRYLPLFDMGMGWIVPATLTFFSTLIFIKIQKRESLS